ncbi:MAG: TIGR00268 family protein, partial [Lachnospiraceae bacterium]|nr:TIGR00268 family protein [Lachnospiraceae bacterium]
EYGIETASKPSMPCLATRFPYGTALSYKDMERVERGETYLKGLGFKNVRIRVHGTIARIEVDGDALGEVVKRKHEIVSCLKELGYVYVTLDLEGFRSGSMDVGLETI